jgi:hypothetical protein
VVGRVLEPLALADLPRLPAYWNFLWDSNPQTYYSSRSSSGSPSKSSMAAEAAAEAASRFAQPRKPYSPRSTFPACYRALTAGSRIQSWKRTTPMPTLDNRVPFA